MAKYTVSVDKDLQDIVPGYLEIRRGEVPQLFTQHSSGDFDTLRKSGHKLAGSGGAYGFDKLTEIGKRLEALAADGNASGSLACLQELKDYLENLEVTYE